MWRSGHGATCADGQEGIFVMDLVSIQNALLNLRARIAQAERQFAEWFMTDEEYIEPSSVVESCVLQLLAIAESLGLTDFREMLHAEYLKVTRSKEGFYASERSPDGDPYSKVLARIRCFLRALDGFFPDEAIVSVTKDVLDILRDIHYVIADKRVFGTAPANETDVHLRIEGILKCLFPDLKHKPKLTKQIKNFEPDTGISSVRTLIEYKFLSRNEDVGPLADAIFADTCGYASPEWKRFLFVIYETKRFRKEKEWNQLLRESGVPESTRVVVLSGEPLKPKKRPRKVIRRSSTTA